MGHAQKRSKDQALPALQLKDATGTKSNGSKSSSPTGIKRFWPPSPKLRGHTLSSSLWTLAVENQTLDKENERCHSTISLSPASSPTAHVYKKPKWYKKLLSPHITNSASKLSTESDSTDVSSSDKTLQKKKKWYRKRFVSKTRTKAYEIWMGAKFVILISFKYLQIYIFMIDHCYSYTRSLILLINSGSTFLVM